MLFLLLLSIFMKNLPLLALLFYLASLSNGLGKQQERAKQVVEILSCWAWYVWFQGLASAEKPSKSWKWSTQRLSSLLAGHGAYGLRFCGKNGFQRVLLPLKTLPLAGAKATSSSTQGSSKPRNIWQVQALTSLHMLQQIRTLRHNNYIFSAVEDGDLRDGNDSLHSCRGRKTTGRNRQKAFASKAGNAQSLWS